MALFAGASFIRSSAKENFRTEPCIIPVQSSPVANISKDTQPSDQLAGFKNEPDEDFNTGDRYDINSSAALSQVSKCVTSPPGTE